MKKSIPVSVVIASVVILILILGYYGWHTLSGGPNADATQANIDYWKQQQSMHQQSPANPYGSGGAQKPGVNPGQAQGAPGH